MRQSRDANLHVRRIRVRMTYAISRDHPSTHARTDTHTCARASCLCRAQWRILRPIRLRRRQSRPRVFKMIARFVKSRVKFAHVRSPARVRTELLGVGGIAAATVTRNTLPCKCFLFLFFHLQLFFGIEIFPLRSQKANSPMCLIPAECPFLSFDTSIAFSRFRASYISPGRKYSRRSKCLNMITPRDLCLLRVCVDMSGIERSPYRDRSPSRYRPAAEIFIGANNSSLRFATLYTYVLRSQ